MGVGNKVGGAGKGGGVARSGAQVRARMSLRVKARVRGEGEGPREKNSIFFAWRGVHGVSLLARIVFFFYAVAKRKRAAGERHAPVAACV